MVNAFLHDDYDSSVLNAAPAQGAAHDVAADLAEHLAGLLGEEVTPEQAADWLSDWTALFATLARIDRRTGGKVGRERMVKPATKKSARKGRGPLARAGRPATVEAEQGTPANTAATPNTS